MEGMLNAFKSGLLGGILAGLTNLVPTHLTPGQPLYAILLSAVILQIFLPLYLCQYSLSTPPLPLIIKRTTSYLIPEPLHYPSSLLSFYPPCPTAALPHLLSIGSSSSPLLGRATVPIAAPSSLSTYRSVGKDNVNILEFRKSGSGVNIDGAD